MKVLDFAKRNGETVFSAAGGLDALWEDAEAIGRVSLETLHFGGGYRATICFRTSGGSTVFAHGEATDKCEALQWSIAEATKHQR